MKITFFFIILKKKKIKKNYKRKMHSSDNKKRIECWRPPTQAEVQAYDRDRSGNIIFPRPGSRSAGIQTKCTGNRPAGCTPGIFGDPWCALDGSDVDDLYTKVAGFMVDQLSDMTGGIAACTLLLGSEGALGCATVTAETGPGAALAAVACAALAGFLCYAAVSAAQEIGTIGHDEPNFYGSIWFREYMMDKACRKVGVGSDYDTFMSPKDLELRRIKEMFRNLQAVKGKDRALGESLGWVMKNITYPRKARTREGFDTPQGSTCDWGTGFGRVRHPLVYTWDLISDALTVLVGESPTIVGGASCTLGVAGLLVAAFAAAEAASDGAATPFVAVFTAQSGIIISVVCAIVSKMTMTYRGDSWGTEQWKQDFKSELCKSNLGGLL
jgi:hypothetical protein